MSALPPHPPAPGSGAPALPPAPLRRAGCAARAAFVGLLGVVVGEWALTLAGREDDTPAAWLVIAVLLLPWIRGAIWALLAGAAALARRSRWVWGLIAAHLVFGLGLRGGLPPSSDEAPADALRVLEWNVARMGVWATAEEGRCAADATKAAVLATVRAEEPAALVLLEITGAGTRALEAAAGLSCEHTDYHGRGGQGTGGLAVCVPRDGAWRIARGLDLPLPPGWRYVLAELSNGARTVNVLALHVLPYGVTIPELETALQSAARGERGLLRDLLRRMEEAAAVQGAQVAAVRRMIAAFRDPTVVAGDFNSAPDSAVHATLRRELSDGRRLSDAWLSAGRGRGATRTIGGLPLRIDYVYTSPGVDAVAARVVDCRCEGGLACSDHRALAVDLALGP